MTLDVPGCKTPITKPNLWWPFLVTFSARTHYECWWVSGDSRWRLVWHWRQQVALVVNGRLYRWRWNAPQGLVLFPIYIRIVKLCKIYVCCITYFASIKASRGIIVIIFYYFLIIFYSSLRRWRRLLSQLLLPGVHSFSRKDIYSKTSLSRSTIGPT